MFKGSRSSFVHIETTDTLLSLVLFQHNYLFLAESLKCFSVQ